MDLHRFSTAVFSALVVSTAIGASLPAEAAPGAALQEARTNARIRQGVGEDIILNSSDKTPDLIASLLTDAPIFEPSEDLYPGQKLREVRAFSRVRRGVGEDIL